MHAPGESKAEVKVSYLTLVAKTGQDCLLTRAKREISSDSPLFAFFLVPLFLKNRTQTSGPKWCVSVQNNLFFAIWSGPNTQIQRSWIPFPKNEKEEVWNQNNCAK